MSRFNYWFVAFIAVVLFFGVYPSVTLAVSVSVTGQAKSEATSFYVNFTNNIVDIDNVTGEFSGQAFSDDLGFIEFGTSGNLDGPVFVDLETGVVKGKAKVVNTGNLVDFNNLSTVVLNTTTGAFTGSVWSIDIGWLNFADTGVFTNLGSRLTNVPASLVATTTIDWSTSVSSAFQLSPNEHVGVKKASNDMKIASMVIDFSSNIDWTGVTGDTIASKTFFHAPAGISAITGGASSSYLLYVYKGDGQSVLICPGATSLAEITSDCAGGFILEEEESNGDVTANVSLDRMYWEISGLTGTGAMSLLGGVVRDSVDRLAVNVVTNHTITFGTNNGISAPGENFTIEFDTASHLFDLSDIEITDIEMTDDSANAYTLASSAAEDTWGVNINTTTDTITFTAPTSGTGYFEGANQIIVNIGTHANTDTGVNQIVNPTVADTYTLLVTINSADPEQGQISIPIVDSDQVNVTGYTNTFISFDIDVNTDGSDCDYDTCPIHAGVAAANGSNYTVDLGELSFTRVNKSNDASIMHSDGISGVINSIYFDLTSNAYNGVIVYVSSQNEGLSGAAGNLIASVENDGDAIDVNSGRYGFNLFSNTSGNGVINRKPACSSSADVFCKLTNTANEVLNTNNQPIDQGRARLDIAAAAAYTNNPGQYSDTLTFIAVPTY